MSKEEYLERFHSIFKETSFAKDRPKHEVYRFTWKSTFDNPIIIRVELKGETGTITVKKTDGSGGYGLEKVGKIILDETRELSQNEITLIRNEIISNKFWESRNIQELPGLDGSSWILEGVKDGTYHLLEKQSPDEGSIYNIATHLILLTSLPEKIPFIELKEKNKKTRIYLVTVLVFVSLGGFIIFWFNRKK